MDAFFPRHRRNELGHDFEKPTVPGFGKRRLKNKSIIPCLEIRVISVPSRNVLAVGWTNITGRGGGAGLPGKAFTLL